MDYIRKCATCPLFLLVMSQSVQGQSTTEDDTNWQTIFAYVAMALGLILLVLGFARLIQWVIRRRQERNEEKDNYMKSLLTRYQSDVYLGPPLNSRPKDDSNAATLEVDPSGINPASSTPALDDNTFVNYGIRGGGDSERLPAQDEKLYRNATLEDPHYETLKRNMNQGQPALLNSTRGTATPSSEISTASDVGETTSIHDVEPLEEQTALSTMSLPRSNTDYTRGASNTSSSTHLPYETTGMGDETTFYYQTYTHNKSRTYGSSEFGSKSSNL